MLTPHPGADAHLLGPSIPLVDKPSGLVLFMRRVADPCSVLSYEGELPRSGSGSRGGPPTMARVNGWVSSWIPRTCAGSSRYCCPGQDLAIRDSHREAHRLEQQCGLKLGPHHDQMMIRYAHLAREIAHSAVQLHARRGKLGERGGRCRGSSLSRS